MIICPNCNTQNSDDAQSCSNCGAPLGEALYRAPAGAPEGVPPEFVELPNPSPPYSGLEKPEAPQPPPAEVAPRAPSLRAAPVGKDRGVAYLLEILPGLLGVLGLGWIYSGNTTVGVALLVGFLIWDLIAILLAVFTGFLACFCTLPLNIIAVIISVLLLNGYIQGHSEAFKS